MKEKESNTIQIMRGIALCMVIFHHLLNAHSNPYAKTVVSIVVNIHVQVFFTISGFLFEKNIKKYQERGITTFIVKKAKELMIPYFAWTMLFSIVVLVASKVPNINTLLISKGYTAKSTIEMCIDSVLFRNPYFESLWFVYVLFVIFIINWFISSKCINWNMFICAAIGSSVIAYFYYDTTFLIPYRVIRYFQWFCLGRITALGEDKICRTLTKKRYCVLITVLFLVLGYSVVTDPIEKIISERILRTAIHCLEKNAFTICGIWITYGIARMISKNSRVGNMLRFIGDKSYPMYLVHNPWLVTPLSIAFVKIIPTNFITELLLLAITVTCSLGISCCAERIGLINSIFFGRQKKKSSV